MGKFYLHKDGLLIQTGECPDGDEELQKLLIRDPNVSIGLGVPPENLLIPVAKIDHAAAVIFKRNQLLLESDWTQLPDVPSNTKDQWAEYRQALRDITKQDGYPENVEFPIVPSKN